MSLQEILEQIKANKVFAEENTDSGPAETLSARRGRKKQAQEKIKLLKEEYMRELMRGAMFTLVTGAEKDALIDGAVKLGCFSVETDSFYKDLVGRLPESLLSGRESISSLFDILGRHLEDMAMELGVLSYPQLIFKQGYRKSISSKEDVVELVKTAINDQVGGEFVGLHAVKSILEKAIESGHASRVTPIFMNTKDAQLVVDLVPALKRLTPNVFVVTVGRAQRFVKSLPGAISVKDVNEEKVKEVLTTIKNSIKK